MNKTVRWKTAQFFEFLWWKRYLKNKTPELYLQNKLKYWKEVYGKLADKLTINERTKILDAGCGPSGMYMLFPHNEVFAVDPLLSEYEKLNIFSYSMYPNVKFFKSTIEEFQFTRKFDVIFCLNVINHVSDIKKAIANLTSCLSDNGKIVYSIDVHNYNFLKFIFSGIPGDILHPHQYSSEDYKRFFEKSGLSVIYNETIKKGLIFNYEVFILTKPTP